MRRERVRVEKKSSREKRVENGASRGRDSRGESVEEEIVEKEPVEGARV